jgi:hypothetical protein
VRLHVPARWHLPEGLASAGAGGRAPTSNNKRKLHRETTELGGRTARLVPTDVCSLAMRATHCA